MINLFNIDDSFNKNKKSIINILINYYGEEYSEIIKKRLENVFFDFSSTPEDDYEFLKKNNTQLSDLDRLLIKVRYKQYEKIKSKSRKLNFKALIKYAKSKFLISYLNKTDIENEKFLSLFTDKNFNSGYIDAFSSKSINLLNNSNIADSIKQSIINDQEKFRRIANSLGIKLENLSADNVDKLIEYRKKLQTIYQSDIAQKSRFGKDILKEIRKRFDFGLTPEDLSDIALSEMAFSGYIQVESKNDIVYHQIIKIPLLHLMNLGIKGLDVNVIHEIIHKIETNGNHVGISIHDDKNTNKIVNEIRTQILAILITRELHQAGVFIYDNPDDYKIEGESSYEILFPLTKEFFDTYEELISNCAINNTPNKLCEYFGEYWEEFSKEINDIFYSHMHYYSINHSIPNIKFNNKIAELINNMKSFKRRSTKNV